MDIGYLFVSIGGFAIGIIWGYNLLIVKTRRQIKKGELPKWLENEKNIKIS